jgi:hypothetical protein
MRHEGTLRLRDQWPAGRDDDWQDAADHAGVHRKTVERIAKGVVPNPGVKTMEALAEYLRKNRRRQQPRQPSQ